MEAMEEDAQRRVRRGRPRKHGPANGLVRRNLLVDPVSLRKLCELYGTTSESEAVRRAIDLVLLDEATESLRSLLATRGGAVDVYGPPPPLPVYLGPDDAADLEDEDCCR